MCSPVGNHDLVPSLPDNYKRQAHSRCLNVKVQATEWSLHPRVFKQICQKWFCPLVDLFATRLNQKVPLYVSPVSDQHAWNTDALNINLSGLTAYAYPSMALLHKVIQKIRQCNCHIILIAPGWPGMPGFGTWCSCQEKSHSSYQCQQHFSNSPTTKCFTRSTTISPSTPGV